MKMLYKIVALVIVAAGIFAVYHCMHNRQSAEEVKIQGLGSGQSCRHDGACSSHKCVMGLCK